MYTKDYFSKNNFGLNRQLFFLQFKKTEVVEAVVYPLSTGFYLCLFPHNRTFSRITLKTRTKTSRLEKQEANLCITIFEYLQNQRLYP
jgi:hypothetical protein